MRIDSFTGDYRFLSNFYPSEIVLDSEKYPTVEHAFQAAKTIRLDERAYVRAAKTPGEAKRLGRKVTLTPGWDELRVGVMHQLLRIKFGNRVLRAMLLDTGDAELVEGNYWNDRFWGVYKGRGENHLGKLLMAVRNELNAEGSCRKR